MKKRNTEKKFVAYGTTAPLKADGLPREVTLVALLQSEKKFEYPTTTTRSYDKDAKATTVSVTTREVLSGIVNTISFGLAITSPQDIKLQKEAQILYDSAQETLKDKPDDAEAKKIVNDLSRKLPLVSKERGFEIALGKARSKKAALTTFVVDNDFFTVGLIKQILKDKLQHVVNDPEMFIRVTEPRKAPAEKLLETVTA